MGLFSACNSEGPGHVEKPDIVHVNFDPGFDFEAVQTFALPDEVKKVWMQEFNRPEKDQPEFVSKTYSEVILSSIRENMLSYGWTEVGKDEEPDVILLPSVTTSTRLYYFYDWSYWYWWYPGWYPGWAWYYAGYYYPVYQSGFRAGTLFIQMTESKGSQPGNHKPVPWSVVINGVMEGDRPQVHRRLKTNINQAFRQSPYLNKNPGA